MRVLNLLEHLNIVQLDVQELINRFESPFDRDVVLKLDGDLVIDKGFEEAGERSACRRPRKS